MVRTYSEGRDFDSLLGHENFGFPERAWFLLLPSENVHWKCSVLLTSASLKIVF